MGRYNTLEYIEKDLSNKDTYRIFESDNAKGYRITTMNTSGMIIDEVKCETKAKFEKHIVHEYAVMADSLGIAQ